MTAGDDEYAGSRPAPLLKEELRQLSELRPWLGLLHIGLEWSAIVGAAWGCWSLLGVLPAVAWVPLYLVVVAFIGARQHDLIIVFMHDGAHRRLHPNRAVNDWFSELVLAWPFLLFSMRTSRRNHFAHHRHLNTERDPDWVRKASWIYPRRPSDMARLLALYLLGFGFARFVYAASKIARWPAAPVDRRFLVAKIAYVAAAVALIGLSGTWLPVLLFWVVPFATWFQLVFNVRSMSDHSEIAGRTGFFAMSRNIRLGPLARLFALGGGPAFFHTEHHLYPSVPYHRLPALHARLMQDPVYAEGLHVTDGFLGFVRECMAAPARD